MKTILFLFLASSAQALPQINPTTQINPAGNITVSSYTAIYGLNAASATLTGTGSGLYSLVTSSGINVQAGQVNGSLAGGTGTAPSLTAGNAINIAGGGANQIPYQSGAGATGFVATGSAGQVLTYGTPPTWQAASGGGSSLVWTTIPNNAAGALAISTTVTNCNVGIVDQSGSSLTIILPQTSAMSVGCIVDIVGSSTQVYTSSITSVGGIVRVQYTQSISTNAAYQFLNGHDEVIYKAISATTWTLTSTTYPNYAAGPYGQSASNPAYSCYDILLNNPLAPSGSYYAVGYGNTRTPANALNVYCDMADNGGGWTLAVIVNSANASHDTTVAVSTGGLNSSATTTSSKWSDVTINAFKSGGAFSAFWMNVSSTHSSFYQTSCTFAATSTSVNCFSPASAYNGSYGSGSSCGSPYGGLGDGTNCSSFPLGLYGDSGQNGAFYGSWSQAALVWVK